MKILSTTRTEVALREIGARVRARRLAQNRRMEDVAEAAGVGVTTVARLERGENASLRTFVRVLRALGELDQVDAFLPEPTVSPVQLAEASGRRRERASRATGSGPAVTPDRDPAPDPDDG